MTPFSQMAASVRAFGCRHVKKSLVRALPVVLNFAFAQLSATHSVRTIVAAESCLPARFWCGGMT